MTPRLSTWALMAALIAFPHYAWAATPRVPQVTIEGTGLQSYFDSVYEYVDARRDQIDCELIRSNVGPNAVFTILFELGATSNGTTLGLYNGHDLHPALMPVFPATATVGWYAVAAYLVSPFRVIINVFDEFGNRVSTRMLPVGDRDGIGFYVSSPDGTFYSQDPRNPEGNAHCLFYRATNQYSPGTWLAFEEQRTASGDRDYDDCIVFVGTIYVELVGSTHTSWGLLKRRFR